MTIQITAEPREKLSIELVGVSYQISTPKTALALKLAVRAKTAGDDSELVLAAIDEWVDKAFGKTDGDAIRARLDDDDDLLDFDHIMSLMEKVIEATTGNPTSSSSASPPLRSITGKT